jgi:hypothetical protein
MAMPQMWRRDNRLRCLVEIGPYRAKYGGRAPAMGKDGWVFLIGTKRHTFKGTYAQAKEQAWPLAESDNQTLITLIDGPKPRYPKRKKREEDEEW